MLNWVRKILLPGRRRIFKKLDLAELEKELGIKIRNPDYFIEALTHRSFIPIANYRYSVSLKSNERLEFLGDSILNMVAGEILFKTYPDATEGQLTRLRSHLVNRRMLAKYARSIKLENFLLMSTSASQSLAKGYYSILANAFEALVAAIYLDSGYKSVEKFLIKIFNKHIGKFDEKFYESIGDNYKSILLEYAQSVDLCVRYKLINVEGPGHDRKFTVEVTVGDSIKGVGTGRNKKEAEQNAAFDALIQLELIDREDRNY